MTDTTAEPILAKIRGLLDKAEATTFAAEAEAFTAKATQLMAKYRIDQAMLDAARPAAQRRAVVERHVKLGSGPYVRTRLSLLSAAADANDVRVLTSVRHDGRVGHLIGTVDDVEATEMLYTSLAIQAARDTAKIAGSSPGQTRRQRRSFLAGFAASVDARLTAQNAAAAAEAERATPGVAIVLADKSALVDDWVRGRYGRVGSLRRTGTGTHSGSYQKGVAAGNRADLGATRVGSGARGALGA